MILAGSPETGTRLRHPPGGRYAEGSRGFLGPGRRGIPCARATCPGQGRRSGTRDVRRQRRVSGGSPGAPGDEHRGSRQRRYGIAAAMRGARLPTWARVEGARRRPPWRGRLIASGRFILHPLRGPSGAGTREGHGTPSGNQDGDFSLQDSGTIPAQGLAGTGRVDSRGPCPLCGVVPAHSGVAEVTSGGPDQQHDSFVDASQPIVDLDPRRERSRKAGPARKCC